jgi:hypothetical protein
MTVACKCRHDKKKRKATCHEPILRGNQLRALTHRSWLTTPIRVQIPLRVCVIKVATLSRLLPQTAFGTHNPNSIAPSRDQAACVGY